MPTAPYTFYVYGSSTNHQTLSTASFKTSMVADDTLVGGTLPEVDVANGWVAFNAWGASPEPAREDDEYSTAFSGLFNGPGAGRWQLTIETDVFDFPDDFTDYTELLQALNSRYVYFAVGTYPVTLHLPHYAIAMKSAHSVEHDYSNGKKALTITLKYRYAHNALIPA